MAIWYIVTELGFQSTRPLRGATREAAERIKRMDISIHAPLAGRDLRGFTFPAESVKISIHAPLAGRDLIFHLIWRIHSLFQSTRPLRGATLAVLLPSGIVVISIHAPLAGRDLKGRRSRARSRKFQSTRPLRGATLYTFLYFPLVVISIHAPLAGRDNLTARSRKSQQHFNPRAPCGARPYISTCSSRTPYFNPRAPCGARRARRRSCRGRLHISIHAPLAGRDEVPKYTFELVDAFQSTRPLRGATALDMSPTLLMAYFNPRAPCGARHSFVTILALDLRFQSTRPLRGATLGAADVGTTDTTFQSTRPLRGATIVGDYSDKNGETFQSTRPLRGATRSIALANCRGLFQSTRPLRGATPL